MCQLTHFHRYLFNKSLSQMSLTAYSAFRQAKGDKKAFKFLRTRPHWRGKYTTFRLVKDAGLCVCGIFHIRGKGPMCYRKSGRAQTHWKAQMPWEDFCIVTEVRECERMKKKQCMVAEAAAWDSVLHKDCKTSCRKGGTTPLIGIALPWAAWRGQGSGHSSPTGPN